MIAGLVLAAGAGERFGGAVKQLAPLDGKPLLEHALAAVSSLDRVVVVLGALGFGEDEQSRIAAPIGLDLGGLTSEETALSIMAEVVAVRNGRDGGRLSAAAGRIHEVGA